MSVRKLVLLTFFVSFLQPDLYRNQQEKKKKTEQKELYESIAISLLYRSVKFCSLIYHINPDKIIEQVNQPLVSLRSIKHWIYTTYAPNPETGKVIFHYKTVPLYTHTHSKLIPTLIFTVPTSQFTKL